MWIDLYNVSIVLSRTGNQILVTFFIKAIVFTDDSNEQ